MCALALYNSLNGRKEDFSPIDESHVRLYACGPTVYNYAHIGNARMAVVFDQLVRLLRVLYPRVTYVSNITDVDDKIMVAARESGKAIEEITRHFEHIYNQDMAALGVAAPDIQPRATEHIAEMIALNARLIEQGHAYAVEGHVLFHVPSYPAYGRLSGRSRDEQVAGARVDVAPFKRDPADFVLWKPSTDDQVGWDSPWGRGRPGWHIECSAMSEKHLGLPFDIHGGGADLKFPHHENEIAQSVCAHGHHNDPAAFARTWVHNGFVTVEGEKMSKSIGNIRLVHHLLDQYDGEVLRLTLLSAHYRQPLDWSENALHQAKQVLDRFYRTVKELGGDDVADRYLHVAEEMMEALCDDLNTPKAIAVLNALSKAALERKDEASKGALIASARLMGVLHQNADQWLGYDTSGDDASRIDALLAERQQARADKNFKRSDEIRDQLAAEGIVIEDTPQGPKWRRAG